MTALNCIIGDSEYNQYVKIGYAASFSSAVPVFFYPKTNTCIVVEHDGDKADLIFPGRTQTPDLTPIDKLLSTITGTNIYIIDYKKMILVLDIENDDAHTWYTRPSTDYEENLIFSGDGRKVLFSAYSQGKALAWALNIVNDFDLSVITEHGEALILNWVESVMGEKIIYANRENILSFINSYIGTDPTILMETYNFSKILTLIDKKKVPLPDEKAVQPALLPAPPPGETGLDVVLINGAICISSLRGKTDFKPYANKGIYFDVPVPKDIISGAVDSMGNIVFRMLMGGETNMATFAETFKLPIYRITSHFVHEKGETN